MAISLIQNQPNQSPISTRAAWSCMANTSYGVNHVTKAKESFVTTIAKDFV
jgi:hypothetical protein